MWTFIISFIVIILFFVYLGWLFLLDVVDIFFNGIIIYVIGLRSYVEIITEKKIKAYVGGLLLGALLFKIMGPLFTLWGLTTWFLFSFLFAQLIMLIIALYEEYQEFEQNN